MGQRKYLSIIQYELGLLPQQQMHSTDDFSCGALPQLSLWGEGGAPAGRTTGGGSNAREH